MGLHQAQLPGQPGVVDAGAGRSAGAAVVAGNQYYIGTGLNYTCRNGANTHLGYQLDADAGSGIGVLQIMDQFC